MVAAAGQTAQTGDGRPRCCHMLSVPVVDEKSGEKVNYRHGRLRALHKVPTCVRHLGSHLLVPSLVLRQSAIATMGHRCRLSMPRQHCVLLLCARADTCVVGVAMVGNGALRCSVYPGSRWREPSPTHVHVDFRYAIQFGSHDEIAAIET